MSGHPNHISTYHGVMHWARQSARARHMTDAAQAAWDSAFGHDPKHPSAVCAKQIPVWTLSTAPLLRKYSGALDLVLSAVFESEYGLAVDAVRVPAAFPGYTGRTVVGSQLLLTHTDLGLAHRAMVAHWSQYVWFRRLFIVFSRYTTMNSLVREA